MFKVQSSKQCLIKKCSPLLVCILIIALVVLKLIPYRQTFTQKFDFQKLDYLYKKSQFAKDTSDRQLIIQDHDLYAYAGWTYLTTGNLETVNIEHPPLGKYFVALSILFFGNQNIGQLFWGFLFLLLLYQLTLKITKNVFLSFLTVFLFSLEKIFQDQLVHSLLNLPLTVFLIILFLTLLKKNNRFLLLIQGGCLGAIAGIKYPSIAFCVFLSLTLYFFIKKEKHIIYRLGLIGLTAGFIFLLTYLPFFIKNPQLLSFYDLQVKALKIHLSHLPEYPKGQVFNVLFFNQWLSWWGEKSYVKIEFWNFLWPILTLNFFFNLWKFKKNLLINLWTLFYLFFLSLRLFFPRYLFLLIPFFYIQLCYNGFCLYKKLIKK